jgi:hypothetical protein
MKLDALQKHVLLVEYMQLNCRIYPFKKF